MSQPSEKRFRCKFDAIEELIWAETKVKALRKFADMFKVPRQKTAYIAVDAAPFTQEELSVQAKEEAGLMRWQKDTVPFNVTYEDDLQVILAHSASEAMQFYVEEHSIQGRDQDYVYATPALEQARMTGLETVPFVVETQ